MKCPMMLKTTTSIRRVFTDRVGQSLHVMKTCYERGVDLMPDDRKRDVGSKIPLQW